MKITKKTIGSTRYTTALAFAAAGNLCWAGQVPDTHYPANPVVSSGLICVAANRIACFSSNAPHLSPPAWISVDSNSSEDFDEPVIAGNLVLAGGNTGVSAFDTGSGQLIWRASTGERTFSPVIHGNVAYSGSMGGSLKAYDIKTGQTLWATQPDHANGWIYSPVIINGLAVTSGENRLLSAFDLKNGRPVWHYPLPHEPVHHPTAVTQTDIVITLFDGQILAFDTARQELRWQQQGSVAARTPVVNRNQLIYLALDRKLRARDLNNGDLLWTSAAEFGGTSFAMSGQHLAAQTPEGYDVWIDARNGRIDSMRSESVKEARPVGFAPIIQGNESITIELNDKHEFGSPSADWLQLKRSGLESH